MFNRIRANELRDEQGRTLSWLAKQLDRSSEVTGEYLSGKRSVDRPLAVTMAFAFGVPASELWAEKTRQNQDSKAEAKRANAA
jgi:plasmid maintenance system antidote protein VapI